MHLEVHSQSQKEHTIDQNAGSPPLNNNTNSFSKPGQNRKYSTNLLQKGVNADFSLKIIKINGQRVRV
jgi:hypothetical protein